MAPPTNAPTPPVITLDEVQRLWEQSSQMFMQQFRMQMGPGMMPAMPFPRFPREEFDRTSTLLNQQLGPEYLSSRMAAGGKRVLYLAGEKVIRIANDIFGYDGWTSGITRESVDFVDMTPDGKWNVGISITTRITISNGCYHEDIGYGTTENGKSRGLALEKAKKEAVTDALKRTLRNFGDVVGNCIYDKDYLDKVVKVRPQKAPFDESNLRRPVDVKRRQQQEQQKHSLVKPRLQSPRSPPRNRGRSKSPPKSPKSPKHASEMEEFFVPPTDDEGDESDYGGSEWETDEVLQGIEKLFAERGYDKIPPETSESNITASAASKTSRSENTKTIKNVQPVKSANINIPSANLAPSINANSSAAKPGQSADFNFSFQKPLTANVNYSAQQPQSANFVFSAQKPDQSANINVSGPRQEQPIKSADANIDVSGKNVGLLQTTNGKNITQSRTFTGPQHHNDGLKVPTALPTRPTPQQTRPAQTPQQKAQSTAQSKFNSPYIHQPRTPMAAAASVPTTTKENVLKAPANPIAATSTSPFKSFKKGDTDDDISMVDFHPGAVCSAWAGEIDYNTSKPVVKGTVKGRPEDGEFAKAKFETAKKSLHNQFSFRPPSIVRPGKHESLSDAGVKRDSDGAAVPGPSAPQKVTAGQNVEINPAESTPSGSKSKKQRTR